MAVNTIDKLQFLSFIRYLGQIPKVIWLKSCYLDIYIRRQKGTHTQDQFFYVDDEWFSTCAHDVAAEDIKLNTTMFGWPQNIEAILELSHSRITSRRERAEEELKARTAECEERHIELSKEIEVFRRKEV